MNFLIKVPITALPHVEVRRWPAGGVLSQHSLPDALTLSRSATICSSPSNLRTLPPITTDTERKGRRVGVKRQTGGAGGVDGEALLVDYVKRRASKSAKG